MLGSLGLSAIVASGRLAGTVYDGLMRRALITALSLPLLVLMAPSCDDESDGCKTDNDCKGDRICDDGMCVSPDTSDTAADSDGDSEGSSGDGSDTASSDSGDMPASCAETGTYCDSNALYSCTTDSLIVDCATCQYVGPGTGSEYDTSCKDEESDCSTCSADDPWTGAGCYFGGGPAVCRG